MKICILSFSGRRGGRCAEISAALRELFAKDEVCTYSFADFDISPCGKCAMECFALREKCPFGGDMVHEIYDAVTFCDAAYFVLPNYCDYPCSNYFAFNERSLCYFSGHEDLLEKYLSVPKKFVVVSRRECDNFAPAFAYQIPETDKPEILFISPDAAEKNNADLRARLARFVGV